MQMQLNLLKRLDALAGPMLCRALTRPQRTVAPTALDDLEGRLLFIRPGGIGDMIMLLPTLRLLRTRFPERPIDVLCEQRNAAVLAMSNMTIEPLRYDTHPMALSAALRTRPYAAVFDTEQFHHLSAVIGALSGAPIRVGFMVTPRRNGLYTHLVDYDLNGREDRQFARLAHAVGVDGDLPSPVGLLRDHARPSLPEAIESLTASPYLLAHPGGMSPAKQWPPANVAAVAHAVHQRLGMRTILVGGRSESLPARRIAQETPGACVNLCGRLSLAQTAELCRRAAVFLGGDSGVTHLAIAMGAPCVTLFGPSDPRKWSVPGVHQRVLQTPLPCSPCSIFGYFKPCRCMDCIRRIDPGDVVESITAIISGKEDPLSAA